MSELDEIRARDQHYSPDKTLRRGSYRRDELPHDSLTRLVGDRRILLRLLDARDTRMTELEAEARREINRLRTQIAELEAELAGLATELALIPYVRS